MGEEAGRSSPTNRATEVAERVKELRQRRGELAAGELPSQESVDLARQRAEESLRHAADAHHAAAIRHEELARSHERAANLLQRAAMRGRDDADLLQAGADEHWQAAHDSHLRSIEDQARGENPTRSSSG